MKILIALALFLFVSLPCLSASKQSAQIPDGVYLVLQSSDKPNTLKTSNPSERILVNDSRFLDASERDKPTYLLLSKAESIPFLLSSKPGMGKDTRGNPKLLLTLSNSQKTPLENFTRKNLGKTIAIVVDEQIVSAHKIKEPITGGRFQISWCSHNACKVLMSKLQSDVE